MPKGVYPRKPRPKLYAADVVAKIDDLYAAGLTQAEIGQEVGLSQKVVFTIMRNHSIAARPAVPRCQSGQANNNWRGDDAGYAAFHKRLYALFGKPAKCSVCLTQDSGHYDYANLSGNYADVSDYASMCRSCHWQYDKKILNISHMRAKLSA